MNMMPDDDRYDARLDEIGEAIAVLARRKRRPQDLAVLIEANDRKLEVLAGADRDELDDAGGDAALALAYVAGLALTLRQALRHYAGVARRPRPKRKRAREPKGQRRSPPRHAPNRRDHRRRPASPRAGRHRVGGEEHRTEHSSASDRHPARRAAHRRRAEARGLQAARPNRDSGNRSRSRGDRPRRAR
jgi:hypothetical protein